MALSRFAMRGMPARLLPLLLLTACAGGTDKDTPADSDSPSDSDTREDTGDTDPVRVDTGYALVYFEGTAALGEATWDGEESWVATSMDGGTTYCRVANALTGVPADVELCPGCTFAFEVEVGAGTATGDACENVSFRADMWEGTAWLYAFAPAYVYGDYGYTYENVLLYGVTNGEEVEWTMTAIAETDGATVIDYEALYSDLWTYYAF